MHLDPRRAVPADRQAIEEIVRQAYSPYISRIGRPPGPMSDDYERLIDAGRVYVVETQATIQGILVLVPEPDAMLLDNVAVALSARGTGIGRGLLEYAEHSARAAGYRAIRLYTHETMTENIALYSRIGYTETHRAEEKGLKRVFMVKHLV
ncbi:MULTISPECIES: GNAT family N-acetyltransferase [Paraburkholderia]|uniref:GNAT family N-acetyltransferase n=1 Tax=Paraburkholderia TaxID=1822464 RepID=UPI0022502FF5|nr:MULTISPECIES: GNAT family N-acetyltransferase [Paraburkholderia]MCX4164710.1 GNAT family N-acetyltransferase [Paraburkholderia megapolitana]MDN7160203.1 GNAT family N-acetyltransferase [Paraburkholderia sp. CHISQ3]MDQ6497250.1 GNAT family N-acetyltransferase [Paraburkholderia megapolitana]